MAEHELYQASPDWLKPAIDALIAAGTEVVAPVEDARGDVNLATIASSDAIAARCQNVQLPLKQVFLPPTEVLFDYVTREEGDVDVRSHPVSTDQVVVIGCRPCDASALVLLDKLFEWDYDDVNYRARRERTTLVTFACTEPDANCFCTSVGGSPHDNRGSDVVVFSREDGSALLKICSAKGRKLVERLGDIARQAETETPLPQAPQLERRFDPDKVKDWLDGNFESDFWREMSLRCLGCAACSYLCPTCHCFDIVDESTWNRGRRRRNWDCCSFRQFTLHASGHNPRPDQTARCRQRVMHKFKYFPERFGEIGCVGCGRCMRNCGVGQNLVNVLATLEAL